MTQPLFNRIRTEIPDGAVIPKPGTSEPYYIKGWGHRRGEPALVYFIPNLGNPASPYQKSITETEFKGAYHQLNRIEKFSRKWFNEALPECAKEGGCNFTTIGGVLELLGEALYSSPGIYKKNHSDVSDRR